MLTYKECSSPSRTSYQEIENTKNALIFFMWNKKIKQKGGGWPPTNPSSPSITTECLFKTNLLSYLSFLSCEWWVWLLCEEERPWSLWWWEEWWVCRWEEYFVDELDNTAGVEAIFLPLMEELLGVVSVLALSGNCEWERENANINLPQRKIDTKHEHSYV